MSTLVNDLEYLHAYIDDLLVLSTATAEEHTIQQQYMVLSFLQMQKNAFFGHQ